VKNWGLYNAFLMVNSMLSPTGRSRFLETRNKTDYLEHLLQLLTACFKGAGVRVDALEVRNLTVDCVIVG